MAKTNEKELKRMGHMSHAISGFKPEELGVHKSAAGPPITGKNAKHRCKKVIGI